MRFDNKPLDKEMLERLAQNHIFLSDDCPPMNRAKALILLGEAMLNEFVEKFTRLWKNELFANCRLKDYEATEEEWEKWLGSDYKGNTKDSSDCKTGQYCNMVDTSFFNNCKEVARKMESNMDEKVDYYVELFDGIRDKTENDSAAIAILQEICKDRRSVQIREEREAKNGEPATDKQKKFMKRLGIEFPKAVTKKEASVLLDEELKNLE